MIIHPLLRLMFVFYELVSLVEEYKNKYKCGNIDKKDKYVYGRFKSYFIFYIVVTMWFIYDCISIYFPDFALFGTSYLSADSEKLKSFYVIITGLVSGISFKCDIFKIVKSIICFISVVISYLVFFDRI